MRFLKYAFLSSFLFLAIDSSSLSVDAPPDPREDCHEFCMEDALGGDYGPDDPEYQEQFMICIYVCFFQNQQ